MYMWQMDVVGFNIHTLDSHNGKHHTEVCNT